MGMRLLVLMNDVETELDKAGMLVGSRDVPVTVQGLRDSVIFAKHVLGHVDNIRHIVASDLARVSRILHYLRLESKGRFSVHETKLLRERDFGILNGTSLKVIRGFQSDIFQHTRICAENGESISQCVSRVVPYVKKQAADCDFNSVVLSHPLVCNMIFNSLLGHVVTNIYPFWIRKCAYVVLSHGDEASPWFKFEMAFNAIEDKQYSIGDIENEFNEFRTIPDIT